MKKIFLEHLEYCKEKMEELNIKNDYIDTMISKIEETELLVPVIGSYSVGKSKFLNNIIGKNYLLEDIRPETALSTEIRYSDKEYVEVITEKGIRFSYEIEEIDKLKENPEDLSHAILYVNSSEIKKLEPFILVDMPGFNSPKDSHNKAIIQYIDKGVHYLVLVSVEEGTINRSTLIQLEPLLSYNKTFDIFLSKSNLRQPSDVIKLKETIEEIIYDNFAVQLNVVPIYDKLNIEDIIFTFDENKAYFNKFRVEMIENNKNIKSNLKILENNLNKDKEKKLEDMEELEILIKDLNKSREKNINDIENKKSRDAINRVTASIKDALYSITDELVRLGMNGNETAIKLKINEVIESRGIVEIKECMDYISRDIVDTIKLDFSFDTSNIVENNFIDDMGSFVLSQISFNQVSENLENLGFSSLLKGIFGKILGVIGLVLPFVLNLFSQSNKEEQKRQKIESEIVNNVIPDIEYKLKGSLKDIIGDHIATLVRHLYDEFEEQINTKKEMIEKIKDDLNSEEKIQILETIKELKEKCEEMNNILVLK